MLRLRQIRYGADNFSYVLYGRREAMVVDGGAVREIESFLVKGGLSLRLVANTHEHPDHSVGNTCLLERHGAEFVNHAELPDGFEIGLEDHGVVVCRTPGHTEDSVCFFTGPFLLSGDTLFNGTIGNCFSGREGDFHQSIRKLMALPVRTWIYAGHDYVRDALAFARRLEPDNDAIDRYGDRYRPHHVFSRLEDEFRVNPYLRFNDPIIIGILRRRGLPVATEDQRWSSLMTLE